MLPVVSQLVKLCKDGLGEWCHWGATTQDITDTATIMQIREGLAIIEKDIDDISDVLAALAKKYRDTPMAGRSNLQQAVPITFGYKVATYLAAFERHKQRLKQLKERTFVFEFGGAAGTLSSLGKDGLRTQVELAKELNLAQPEIAWHTVHDRIAEVGCFLGLVTGICGKIASRRETDDADRGRRGVRAVPRGPRLVLDHAAEAQSDLLRLHHGPDRRGPHPGGGTAQRHGAGPRARHRPVGNRMAGAAGHFVLTAGCLSQTKFLMSGLQVTKSGCERTSTSPRG